MSDSPPVKRCTICRQELPATSQYFAPRAKSVYGVRAQCRQCMKDRQLKRVHQAAPGTQKQCSRCKQHYPATEQYFQHDWHCKDSFCSACKNCTNSTNKHILTSLPIPEDCKCCLKCEKVYPATSQYFPSVKGVQRNHCRVCVRANSYKNYRNTHPQKEALPEGYKRCFGCFEVLPATKEYFDTANSAKGTFHSRCKPCAKAYRAIMTDESRCISLPQGTMKQCSHCKKTFPATSEYFHKGKIIYGGLRAICKSCFNMLSNQYTREHPEVSKAGYNNRRARKQGNGGRFTSQDVKTQIKAQKGKCYYCGKKLDKYHIDHVIPLSRGGSNDPSNLVIACPTCNLRKGDKLPHEFFEGGRLL